MYSDNALPSLECVGQHRHLSTTTTNEKGKGRSTEHTSTASFLSFLPVDSVLWTRGKWGLVLFRARWRTSHPQAFTHADCVASESSLADRHGRASLERYPFRQLEQGV